MSSITSAPNMIPTIHSPKTMKGAEAKSSSRPDPSSPKSQDVEASTRPAIVSPNYASPVAAFCSPVGEGSFCSPVGGPFCSAVGGGPPPNLPFSLPPKRQRRHDRAAAPALPTTTSLPPPPPLEIALPTMPSLPPPLEMMCRPTMPSLPPPPPLEMFCRPTMDEVTKSSSNKKTAKKTVDSHVKVETASTSASPFDRRERRRRALVVATWRRRLQFAGNASNNIGDSSSQVVEPSAPQDPLTDTSIEGPLLQAESADAEPRREQRRRITLEQQEFHASSSQAADDRSSRITSQYADFSNRRVMRRHIRSLISRRLPPNVSRRLSRSTFVSEWASAIESCLYKTCASVEDYANLNTLERRVAVVSAAVSRRQEQQQYELLQGRQRLLERRRMVMMQPRRSRMHRSPSV